MTLDPCWEYTFRWPQLVDDLLSGDRARVERAMVRLEERDRELELRICQATSSGLPKAVWSNATYANTDP